MESAGLSESPTLVTVKRIEEVLADRIPVKRPHDDLVPASVLLLLREGEQGAEVLLSERSDDVKDHKGQVSLPGGMREECDRDHLATAVRESVEEVGLDPDRLRILGRLDDYRTVTGYHVTPFVGVLESFEGLEPKTAEIREVFSFPLTVMADNARLRRIPAAHPDGFGEILFVEYEGHMIWGATARMLNGLLELLS